MQCGNMIMSEEIKIFTDLLTVAPQFNGHGSSLKAHVVATWFSSSCFFIRVPHAHTMSLNGHSWTCSCRSCRLQSWWHRSHGLSSNWHCRTCCLAVSSFNISPHQEHSPSTMAIKSFANRFFYVSSNWLLALLTSSFAISFEMLHADATKTMAAWCRNLGI